MRYVYSLYWPPPKLGPNHAAVMEKSSHETTSQMKLFQKLLCYIYWNSFIWVWGKLLKGGSRVLNRQVFASVCVSHSADRCECGLKPEVGGSTTGSDLSRPEMGMSDRVWHILIVMHARASDHASSETCFAIQIGTQESNSESLHGNILGIVLNQWLTNISWEVDSSPISHFQVTASRYVLYSHTGKENTLWRSFCSSGHQW